MKSLSLTTRHPTRRKSPRRARLVAVYHLRCHRGDIYVDCLVVTWQELTERAIHLALFVAACVVVLGWCDGLILLVILSLHQILRKGAYHKSAVLEMVEMV